MSEGKYEALGGLDQDLDSDDVTLISKDGREFKIGRATASISKFLALTLDSEHIDFIHIQYSKADRVPIDNVSGDVLSLVLEYMTYHTTQGRSPADIREISKPLRSLEMKKLVEDPWDAEFTDKMSSKQIFDIILAANYMQIDPLLQLFCAKTATLIKNKSQDEIRKLFREGSTA